MKKFLGGFSSLNLDFLFLFVLFLSYDVVIFLYFPNLGAFLLRPYEYISFSILSIAILLGFLNSLKNRRFVYPKFSLYYLLFIIFIILPSFFSPIENFSLFSFYSIYLTFGFFYWLFVHQFNLKKLKTKILSIFFLSAVLHTFIGYIQLFNLTDYFSSLHLGNLMTSVFQQKNVFASFLATSLLIALLLLQYSKKKFYTVFILIASVFISSALIIALSRAGIIGFILGIFSLILIFRYLNVNLLHIWKYIISIIFGFLAGFFILNFVNPSLRNNAIGTTIIKESSNMQRILMFKSALEMFKEKPLYGVGLGDFIAKYPFFQKKVLKEDEHLRKFAVSSYNHPHNEILRIFAEGGIIGILGLLIALFGFAKLIRKLFKEKSKSLVYLPLLFPICFHMMVEFPLDLSILHKVLFLTLLSFLTYEKVKYIELSPRFYTVGIVSSIFSIWISIWNLKTFMDYSNMILFLKKYKLYKKLQPKLIKNAQENWYLSDFAYSIYYDSLILQIKNKKNLSKEDINTLIEYLKFAQTLWYKMPSKSLLKNQVIAFTLLGKATNNIIFFDKAMKLAEKGEKMFPKIEDWKKLKAIILNELILTTRKEGKHGR